MTDARPPITPPPAPGHGAYREPAGNDTQPNVAHPFGHGRGRCPVCGTVLPGLSVAVFEDMLRVSHDRTRIFGDRGGCDGLWLTRTWEHEQQVEEDRRRLPKEMASTLGSVAAYFALPPLVIACLVVAYFASYQRGYDTAIRHSDEYYARTRFDRCP